MADCEAEFHAQRAREQWKVFARHYWTAIMLTAAFPVGCLIILVASYINPGYPADIWLFYSSHPRAAGPP